MTVIEFKKAFNDMLILCDTHLLLYILVYGAVLPLLYRRQVASTMILKTAQEAARSETIKR